MQKKTEAIAALAVGASALFLIACGNASSPNDSTDAASQPQGRSGVMGWHVLDSAFQDDNPLDGMTFEWDYFSIHDRAGAFTGIVGYLIANPRQRDDLYGNMVPKGGNVAIAGQWNDGTRAAEYKNFGYQNLQVGADQRSFTAEDADSSYARMVPNPAENTLQLEGRTKKFEWNLAVSNAWPEIDVAPASSTDIGRLDPVHESWNVDVLWPATRVVGEISNREAGTSVTVDGIGYREDSFGRWAFNFGGWDFFFLYDPTTPVSLVLQTYHYESDALDFVDVAFKDGGELVTRRMMAQDGNAKWWHEGWHFDAEARQCVPRDTYWVAEDATYKVEAVANIADNAVPLLSDATEASKQFVIFEFFPQISGTITRKTDGAVVTTFHGQGGGELAVGRTNETSMTDADCAQWGSTFTSPGNP